MNALRRAIFAPIVLLLLAACSAIPATVAPTVPPTAVPTVKPTDTAAPPAPTPTMAATEMPTAAPSATTAMDHDHAADPFRLSVAQYFLDSAGFHGMAETLSDTQQINTSYPGIVTRVTKVISQTTWPEDLHDQAQEFLGALNTFSAALAADRYPGSDRGFRYRA